MNCVSLILGFSNSKMNKARKRKIDEILKQHCLKKPAMESESSDSESESDEDGDSDEEEEAMEDISEVKIHCQIGLTTFHYGWVNNSSSFKFKQNSCDLSLKAMIPTNSCETSFVSP